MNQNNTDTITVQLNIDAEQLPYIQASLAFLADVCQTYGDGEDSPIHKCYREALGAVLFVSSAIGEAVLNN